MVRHPYCFISMIFNSISFSLIQINITAYNITTGMVKLTLSFLPPKVNEQGRPLRMRLT